MLSMYQSDRGLVHLVQLSIARYVLYRQLIDMPWWLASDEVAVDGVIQGPATTRHAPNRRHHPLLPHSPPPPNPPCVEVESQLCSHSHSPFMSC
ncbi:hypothetical protein GW17_00009147 [Ensete ventricosum]|nr:hypothetical protein GW17_00009147 [Ensete ventricosum]